MAVKTKKTVKLNIAVLCLCLAAVAVSVWLLGKLLEPKYMSGVLEGAMVREYYDEEHPHDVIFVGDCEVYENFSPVTMWEEYGITSYIRGSAQQLIWQSYYLLEETFEYESPKIVVYNVQSMKYSEPQSEAYNRMTLDGMRLSGSKVDAIKASMTEDEDMISYFIPLLRYHSRWNDLGSEDFEYMFGRDKVTVAGYLMRADVKPMTKLPTPSVLSEPELGERCWEYLDKMRILCENNGAKLILIKSPSLWPYWYDEWDAQIADYAEKYGLDYLNFLPLADEIGIDMQTDTYDAGLHLNIYGAEKLSRYFGEILSSDYGLEDHRNDADIAADWDEKCERYYALLDAQLRELEEYGYLKSWTLEPEG